MPITELDIQRLRQEAERDLAALRRVEAMLARGKAKSNGSAVSGKTSDAAAGPGANTGLKSMIVAVMKGAAPMVVDPGTLRRH